MSEPSGQSGDGLWAGLRRRKVVQWGIAYVAAAWGLLQGLAYLSTVFQWPAQLQRPVTMAFLVGLPIALVLAWYHGDRGHQRVSGREFSILTVLLLIGGGLFWWVGRMPVAPPTTMAAGAASGVAQPAADAKSAGTSIAVLPFVNMSGDKDNEYFSDGISEELLNVLVRVDGLGVASRTSSFGYKGSQLGTAAIASALKVNHVLEGSVRKAGNHVRITAQLIDAVNDRHLWSETYDRELTDIFAIQEEIANSIVDALREELGPSKTTAAAVTVRADTKNVEAYQLYLKARELFIARKDLSESIRLLEKATQMDPQFARGWELLAAVCSVAPSWGVRDRDYYAMASVAARRALGLDPTLSMAWAALANARPAVHARGLGGQFRAPRPRDRRGCPQQHRIPVARHQLDLPRILRACHRGFRSLPGTRTQLSERAAPQGTGVAVVWQDRRRVRPVRAWRRAGIRHQPGRELLGSPGRARQPAGSASVAGRHGICT